MQEEINGKGKVAIQNVTNPLDSILLQLKIKPANVNNFTYYNCEVIELYSDH